jgi:regulator of RNase E activity RraA
MEARRGEEAASSTIGLPAAVVACRGTEGGAAMTAPAGSYLPPTVNAVDVTRPDPDLLRQLATVSGLSSAVSDLLDARGLQLAVPASAAPPLQSNVTIAGPVITLRYLPERSSVGWLAAERQPGRMAHNRLFELAQPGDVAVIDGSGSVGSSLLGGQAAGTAKRAGLAGCLVGGAARDVDEIRAHDLPVWSVTRTPMTSQRRLEAIEINGRVSFCGVQVRPGDIAVADDSGICFIPNELFAEIAAAILSAAE